MSKKRKSRQPPKRMRANDSFSNPLARIGIGTPNLMEATDYPITRLTQNYTLMNSLYRNHWIIRRIIDTIPEDMCKNWIQLQTQVSPTFIKRFETVIKDTSTKKKIIEALKWGRLYGGAGAIVMIDGHEDILDQPLNYDTIMPKSYCGLLVRDRWTGISPSLELVTNPRDKEFGLPKYYDVTTSDNSYFRVHHSRVLRFIGRDIPEIERQMEVFWGVSEIEHVFDELKKRDNTSYNIANLIFRAYLFTMKTENLDEVSALGDVEVQKDIYRTIQAQNWLMNNQGIYLLGKNDELDTRSYTFSGLPQIQENFMYDIAGAAEMPFTKLFGRSPAGLNATGESDMQNYYDSIGQKQDAYLSPALDKLFPIIALSEWGYIPDDFDYTYNQIGTPSNKDKSDLADKITESIGKQYDRGLISAKIALKEFKQQSAITGVFTNITDEDIEKASDELVDNTDESITLPMDFKEHQSNQNIPATDAVWNESEHPRRDDGKFGNGSGESNKSTGNHSDKNGIMYKNIDSELKSLGLLHDSECVMEPKYIKVEAISIHAEQRLKSRGISREIAQKYIDESMAMIQQSKDKYNFIAKDGSSIVLESGRLISVIPKEYFDPEMARKVEVIEKWIKKK